MSSGNNPINPNKIVQVDNGDTRALVPTAPAAQRGHLDGREVEIIPTKIIVADVLVTIVTAGFITMVVLAALKIMSVATWYAKAGLGVTGVVSVCQVLVTIGLISLYFQEKKRRDTLQREEKMLGDPDEKVDQALIERQGNSSSAPKTTPKSGTPAKKKENSVTLPPFKSSLTIAEWSKKLQGTPCEEYGPHGRYYDLDKQQPIALGKLGPQLILLGTYDRNKPDFSFENHLLVARLPQCQLKAFPERIAGMVLEDKNDQVECYFMLIDNTSKSGPKRNIALHPMVFSDYAEGKETATVKMGMDSPQGIKLSHESTRGERMPERGRAAVYHLSVHPDNNNQPALSPDVAHFNIDRKSDLSSLYFGTKFNGRAVAVQMVIVNKVNNETQKLIDASGAENIAQFLAALEQMNFKDEESNKLVEKITNTFAHPDQIYENTH